MKKVKENNYKKKIYGKNSIMKIIIIILFFILIAFLSAKFEICIEKLQFVNNKIKFHIEANIYIFKYLKIYSRRIRKRDIIKLIDFSKKERNFRKEKKIIRKVNIEISKINLKINYGIRHVYLNIYTYAFLNALVPMTINRYLSEKANVDYNINTDFKRNFLEIELISKIEISVFKTLIRQKNILPRL